MDHGGGHGGHGGSGGHGDHGDAPAMPKCSMNMLWNAQVEDTCVVFRSWHISGSMGMFISCAAIVAITVAYAAVLARMRAYERRLAAALPPAPTGYGTEDTPAPVATVRLNQHIRLTRAATYAFTVAISYFLMLVAMTYNTYLCTAIVLGAFIGHYLYEPELFVATGGRGLACHSA